MKIILKICLKDPLVKITLLLALILNGLTWLLLVLFLPRDEFLPLSYNIQMGINWTGPWWYAFVLPVLGLVIILINNFIACLVFLKEKILAYFLAITAVLVQIFLLISSLMTVLLNR